MIIFIVRLPQLYLNQIKIIQTNFIVSTLSFAKIHTSCSLVMLLNSVSLLSSSQRVNSVCYSVLSDAAYAD